MYMVVNIKQQQQQEQQQKFTGMNVYVEFIRLKKALPSYWAHVMVQHTAKDLCNEGRER